MLFGMKRDLVGERFLKSKIKMRKNSLIQLHVIDTLDSSKHPFQRVSILDQLRIV